MATRKYLTNDLSPQESPRAIEDRELIIEILPRMYTRWEGTATQLMDEGLIPKNFEWPEGRGRKEWRVGDLSYWLGRTRPSGIKGPMSVWVHGDWWFLRVSLTAEEKKGWAPGRLYEKRCAYEREVWEQTPAAQVQWARCRKAIADEAYQAFRQNATGGLDRARRQSRSN